MSEPTAFSSDHATPPFPDRQSREWRIKHTLRGIKLGFLTASIMGTVAAVLTGGIAFVFGGAVATWAAGAAFIGGGLGAMGALVTAGTGSGDTSEPWALRTGLGTMAGTVLLAHCAGQAIDRAQPPPPPPPAQEFNYRCANGQQPVVTPTKNGHTVQVPAGCITNR